MRMPHFILAATAGAMLAACATPSNEHAPAGAASNWISYTCSDGQEVKAAYPDSDTALLEIKGSRHSLHSVISASGARYTGDGWQWWTKGMHDGMLAPLAAGESIASAAGVNCHAD
ncbi:MliC family protein [Dyella acidiphila]|uniref:MliC family protein n=1 Tax=Dyella acidiphila TaxID=2775866 RepID=A0ABR9G445_9GAMM|nr:MliC family protein [Dyella acidiphila]MBE1158795.1 MliC family protein [Dyella acidiphila]